MNAAFNSTVLATRTVAEQDARLVEVSRTEAMLASDLGITRWKLRVMRWGACALRAVQFNGRVCYTLEEITAWRRLFTWSRITGCE